jgi:predicted dienelactone hydrolase
LTASLAADSLSGIAAKVTIVNLGNPGTIAPHLDASEVPASLPGATYVTLPGATSLSAMATCKPGGAEILLAEGEDDAICREGPSLRDRAHAWLADLIAGAVRPQ